MHFLPAIPTLNVAIGDIHPQQISPQTKEATQGHSLQTYHTPTMHGTNTNQNVDGLVPLVGISNFMNEYGCGCG